MEEGNSKYSDFLKNGANRLCTYVYTFFSFVQNRFPFKGTGTSTEGGHSECSDFLKNGVNRLCIVCVRMYTHFFHLCVTSSQIKGSEISIVEGNSKQSESFQKRCQLFVYRLCTFVYTFFRLCATPSHARGTGTSMEEGNSKCFDFLKVSANRLCTPFFSFVCHPFLHSKCWNVYRRGKFKMARFPQKRSRSFVYTFFSFVCSPFPPKGHINSQNSSFPAAVQLYFSE